MDPKFYRLLRTYLWPGGRTNQALLTMMERDQWLPPDEFNTLILRRMQALVSYAYQNVPYYHRVFDAADIHPNDVQSIADFQKLPLLDKPDINQHREDLLDPNFPRKQLTPNETGGSTGEPARFYNEEKYWRWNAAGENRSRRWYGIQKGDKIAWIWGNQRDMPDWNTGNRVKAWLINERHLNAFALTEDKMREFAHMLQNWQPDLLKGYATAMTLFAQFVEAENIRGIRPKFMETTSEKLYPHQREILERVFKCKVSDVYGSREMGTIAQECPEYGRLHVFSDVRFMEIVANGKAVAPGEMGEVVMTNFIQFAFPFIRYRNGDFAIMDPNPCPCGRSLPVVKEILGRTNDYLVSSEGTFIHSEFFAYTFRVKPEVDKFQVYQPDKNHLQIRLVCNQPVDQAWLDGVKNEVQNRFGPQTEIDLTQVDDIPLTKAGKYRYIISEVKPDFM